MKNCCDGIKNMLWIPILMSKSEMSVRKSKNRLYVATVAEKNENDEKNFKYESTRIMHTLNTCFISHFGLQESSSREGTNGDCFPFFVFFFVADNAEVPQFSQGSFGTRVMYKDPTRIFPISRQGNSIINQDSILSTLVIFIIAPTRNDIGHLGFNTLSFVHRGVTARRCGHVDVMNFCRKFPSAPLEFLHGMSGSMWNARQNVGMVRTNGIPQSPSVVRPWQGLVEFLRSTNQPPHLTFGHGVGTQAVPVQSTYSGVEITQHTIQITKDMKRRGCVTTMMTCGSCSKRRRRRRRDNLCCCFPGNFEIQRSRR
mmetsp:Transcript_18377/g.42560  ORF Transcript_18377/g.42560 Transcript_18377/m.42560 type:complete len:313 (-) Transcript_18377:221-1159(-)